MPISFSQICSHSPFSLMHSFISVNNHSIANLKPFSYISDMHVCTSALIFMCDESYLTFTCIRSICVSAGFKFRACKEMFFTFITIYRNRNNKNTGINFLVTVTFCRALGCECGSTLIKIVKYRLKYTKYTNKDSYISTSLEVLAFQ